MSSPIVHVGMSSIIAGGAYLATNSPEIALLSFASGSLIDLDHLIDYGLGKGEKKGLEFLKPHFYEKQSKIHCFLHSYEIIIALLIICSLFNYNSLGIWVSLSYLVHIIVDQIAYKHQPLFYSLIYRIKHKFDSSLQGKEYPPQSLSPRIILIISIIYLLLYGTLLSTYHIPEEKTAIGTYIALAQWAIPSLLLIFFILLPVTKYLRRFLNISYITHIMIALFIVCVFLQSFNISGLWWSWDTMGLISIIVLLVLTLNKGRMSDVDTILISLSVIFIGFGSWEIIYQVGVLKYYDFFGVDVRNFWIVMMQLMFWIFPSIIAVIFVKSKYNKVIHFNYYVLIAFALSIIATILWFANGFAIPIIWEGTKPYLTNDSSLFIGISRYSQAFWNIGVALLFIPIKGFKYVKAI